MSETYESSFVPLLPPPKSPQDDISNHDQMICHHDDYKDHGYNDSDYYVATDVDKGEYEMNMDDMHKEMYICMFFGFLNPF